MLPQERLLLTARCGRCTFRDEERSRQRWETFQPRVRPGEYHELGRHPGVGRYCEFVCSERRAAAPPQFAVPWATMFRPYGPVDRAASLSWALPTAISSSSRAPRSCSVRMAPRTTSTWGAPNRSAYWPMIPSWMRRDIQSRESHYHDNCYPPVRSSKGGILQRPNKRMT